MEKHYGKRFFIQVRGYGLSGVRLLFAFYFLLVCCCAPTVTGKPTADLGAKWKTFKNEKFRYSISYPSHWFPSGIVYSNAFEIRNYDPKSPQSVFESNRASVIVVDTVNENSEATGKFLETIAAMVRDHQRITIDGQPALRVRSQRQAQRLGPGASRSSTTTSTESKTFHYIETYIADGKHMISLEGSAPLEAEAFVVEEIVMIQQSVKFTR